MHMDLVGAISIVPGGKLVTELARLSKDAPCDLLSVILPLLVGPRVHDDGNHRGGQAFTRRTIGKLTSSRRLSGHLSAALESHSHRSPGDRKQLRT